MTKICFVINKLTDGGAERVTSVISSYLQKMGYYEVSVVTFEKNINEYVINPEIKRTNLELRKPANIKNTVRNFLYIRKELLKLKCDCYIGIDIFANLIVAFLGMTSYRNTIISERNAPKQVKIKFINKILRKCLYGFADTIVFQTSGARNDYEKKIRKKGVIIPNPIIENLPYCMPTKKSFCASGRIVAEKNYKLLIDAFKIVYSTYQQYSLSIYGQGSLHEEISEYINSVGLSNVVFLEGYFNDIHNVIKSNEIYVLSSNYEGLPNALMEAMAMGFPVISTDCPPGGPRSLIENGVNGYLVPINDKTELAKKMLYLIENEHVRNSIGENAKKIREDYSIKIIGEKWRECIERTCYEK